MKIQRIICLLLSIVMVFGMLTGCRGDAPVITDSSESTIEPDTTDPISEEQSEIAKAQELGIIPTEWNDDLSANADFAGFHQMMTSLITLCDETALSAWEENVDTAEFPQQTMHGDDANDGLTPQTAWATLNKVNGANLQRGDGVYFERGGLWCGQLWAQEGVIYSAYGSG